MTLTDESMALAQSGPRQGMIDVAGTRAAQEVQAAMVIAKKFPRDETAAFNRIMQACSRKILAEQACYAYPRGGETVTGPSIRLAEVLAQSWGNIDTGIVELEQRNGESTMMAYAWDLETNSRDTKIFNTKHERHTKIGVKKLIDPRDIYEMAANVGSRRKRACILSIIPGDIVEAAVNECERTMAGNTSEPIADRVRAMVANFAKFGVTQEMIESRLQHPVTTIIEQELVGLKKIFFSIRDGIAGRESFFEVGGSASGSLKDRIDATKNPQPSPATEQAAPPVAPTANADEPANAGGGAADESQIQDAREESPAVDEDSIVPDLTTTATLRDSIFQLASARGIAGDQAALMWQTALKNATEKNAAWRKVSWDSAKLGRGYFAMMPAPTVAAK